MESFREMSKEELQAQEVEVNKKYQEFKDLHLSLNMARGKPAPDQIDHANGMLETMTDYHAKDGLDVRNYGVLDGLPDERNIQRFIRYSSKEYHRWWKCESESDV